MLGTEIPTGNLVLIQQQNQNTPQTVNLGAGRTAVSVSAGSTHTCAILDDGSLKCWGYNFYGQLGIGSTIQHTTHKRLISELENCDIG